MKRLLLIIMLILAACGSDNLQDIGPDDVLQEKEVPVETPKPVLETIEEPEVDVQLEEPKVIPKDISPMYCVKLSNMSIDPEESLPENVAIAIAVGTDSTKKGVYDLGYYHRGIFRIGRQGLKTAGVPVSIKLRGPGSISSEPLKFAWTCDGKTHETFLPALTQDTIFYVDSYARLYWRDDQMDGTGTTMDSERALVDEYRYT